MELLASFIKFRFFALMALLLLVVASGGVTLYCQVVMGQISPHSCYFHTFVNRWIYDTVWFCCICAYLMVITIDSRKFRPGSIGDLVTVAIWGGFAGLGLTSPNDMANLAKCLGKADVLNVLFYWSIVQPVQIVLICMLSAGWGCVAAEESSKQKFKQHLKLLSSIKPVGKTASIEAPSAPEGNIPAWV